MRRLKICASLSVLSCAMAVAPVAAHAQSDGSLFAGSSNTAADTTSSLPPSSVSMTTPTDQTAAEETPATTGTETMSGATAYLIAAASGGTGTATSAMLNGGMDTVQGQYLMPFSLSNTPYMMLGTSGLAVAGNAFVMDNAVIGGNIGVGISTPVVALHINADQPRMLLDTTNADKSAQSRIDLSTLGNGNHLGVSGNKGWQIFARGNNFASANYPSELANDLGFGYWDGSAWHNYIKASNQGNVAIGYDSGGAAAKLDVAGEVKVASTGAACTAATAGAIRFTGTGFQGCVNGAWTNFTMGAAGGAAGTGVAGGGSAGGAAHSYVLSCTSDAGKVAQFAATAQADGTYLGITRPAASTWVVQLDAGGSVVSKNNCYDWPNVQGTIGSFPAAQSGNALCEAYAMGAASDRAYGYYVPLAACTVTAN